MGRKLEFDKNKALDQARLDFWRKGYSATSMRDLAESLQLHLGSVYNALGDKERVFENAMMLHLEQCIVPQLTALDAHADPLQALHDYIETIYSECAQLTESHGCFLVNSLLTLYSINDTISVLVDDYRGRIAASLTSCVARAQVAGRMPRDKAPDQYAHYIIGVTMSMRTMQKLGVDMKFLRDIRDLAFKTLDCGLKQIA